MVKHEPKADQIPEIVFGTSGLGNLYRAETYENKKAVIKACLANAKDVAFFDTAGKYGAGLALEVLGSSLEDLQVDISKVIICNKLGWYRTDLTDSEPSFEPGIWKELKFDAVQKISYYGILECFEQGNHLLGSYNAQYVSVHDPDEYLFAALNSEDYDKRYNDILQAYRALADLKLAGRVKAIGVGAKDWKVIRKISQDVTLDWVMIANSLTIKDHPIELIQFVADLYRSGIPVINSAIFNGGFLTGSNFYNYRQLNTKNKADQELIRWRTDFHQLCRSHGILPSMACYQFSKYFPGIKSIAMSTSKPEKVAQNILLSKEYVPKDFWISMVKEGLLKTLVVPH